MNLFKTLKSEAKAKGMTQQQVSELLQRENNNLWKSIKNGSIKLETLLHMTYELGLELYVVNPEEDTESKVEL